MIKYGYTLPTKLDGEQVVSKPRSKCDEKDFTMVNINSKTISRIIDLTCS